MALKYTGGGFIPNVPARDLTEEEVKIYGGADALVKTGLYVSPGVIKIDSEVIIVDGPRKIRRNAEKGK